MAVKQYQIEAMHSLPVVDEHYESNIKGLYLVGDLARSPVLKTAVNQGYEVVQHIASLPELKQKSDGVYDVAILGAGAAGLSAALEAKKYGLRYLLLDKREAASTVVDFSRGKIIYAEPRDLAVKSDLPVCDDCPKEILLEGWYQAIQRAGLEIHEHEEVRDVRRQNGRFEVVTSADRYSARTVILAMGKRGNPRKLGAPGEHLPKVQYKLTEPDRFNDRDVLVVGGGDSAIENALALCWTNRVTLSYRRSEFARPNKRNLEAIQEAMRQGRVKVIFNSEVCEIRENEVTICKAGSEGEQMETLKNDVVFIQIGAELPVAFLRKLGIRFETDWTWQRYLTLAVWAAMAYVIYAVSRNKGIGLLDWVGSWFGTEQFTARIQQAMTFTGNWRGFEFVSSPGFWYSAMYTVVMVIFGLQAARRWGKKSSYQRWRYVSLLGFQVVFFFLLPNFVAPFAGTPEMRAEAWRSYGLFYAWPLFIYTFFTHTKIWLIWGAVLAFVVIPLFARYFGKAYCTWVCGCGGLAETLGDRWRHHAPKGQRALAWEKMNYFILAWAVLITAAYWLNLKVFEVNTGDFLTATNLQQQYYLIVDWLLVGVVPIALYPILGGKVWCRYWCPLALYMELISRWFSDLVIQSNDKCISCGECTRYCQVGIDVMSFA
ncbi:MAG: NAD(P)-binding domain-containing protein, partial [Acidobacteria bacterium]|nr:NAD(P)-binding domain-containing protein [Acidobacteriota bacterium]